MCRCHSKCHGVTYTGAPTLPPCNAFTKDKSCNAKCSFLCSLTPLLFTLLHMLSPFLASSADHFSLRHLSRRVEIIQQPAFMCTCSEWQKPTARRQRQNEWASRRGNKAKHEHAPLLYRQQRDPSLACSLLCSLGVPASLLHSFF